MQFEFATATRIVFGDGVVSKLADLVAPLGTRCLVVTGANPSRFASSVAVLRSRGIEVTTFATLKEQSVSAPSCPQSFAGIQAGRGGWIPA